MLINTFWNSAPAPIHTYTYTHRQARLISSNGFHVTNTSVYLYMCVYTCVYRLAISTHITAPTQRHGNEKRREARRASFTQNTVGILLLANLHCGTTIITTTRAINALYTDTLQCIYYSFLFQFVILYFPLECVAATRAFCNRQQNVCLILLKFLYFWI